MKYDMQNMSQRQLNYAIIDEVDSILIDEARTPLIISGPASDKTHFYKLTSSFVNKVSSKDFEIDEKNKNIHLTEEGLTKFEDLLKKSGLELKGGVFDSQNIELYHFFMQSLKASHLNKKDVDYIIKDKEVVIIDEFTGRMMEGRRYSEGLHQAIEAKENLPIRSENQTLASITFQNYFKLYNKISGMTGTAKT
jgi:preprotein translocase subunit SecA